MATSSYDVLLLLGLLSCVIAATNRDVCQNTETGVVGECIELHACPSLFALTSRKPLEPHVLQILKLTRCGFVGTVSKHCCPFNGGSGGWSPEPVTEEYHVLPGEETNSETISKPAWRPEEYVTMSPERTTENYYSHYETSTSKWQEPPLYPETSTSYQGFNHNTSPQYETTTNKNNFNNPFAQWWIRPPKTTSAPSNHEQNAWTNDFLQPVNIDAGPVNSESPESRIKPQDGPANSDHQFSQAQIPMHLLPLQTCGTSLIKRIIRGKETYPGNHPWMARIGYNTTGGKIAYRCGGVLITPRYVLTAAHCTVNTPPNVKLSYVLLGEYDTGSEIDCIQVPGTQQQQCSPPPQRIRVTQIISHPEYHTQRLDNDIAILRLAYEADLSSEAVQPICLPVGNLQSQLYDRTTFTVTGWGVTEKGEGSQKLLAVKVTAADRRSCGRLYQKQTDITNAHICAGGADDSCTGDSGGPLSVVDTVMGSTRTVLAGLVSFGATSCGVPGQPAVYTRVGHFMPWILSNLTL